MLGTVRDRADIDDAIGNLPNGQFFLLSKCNGISVSRLSTVNCGVSIFCLANSLNPALGEDQAMAAKIDKFRLSDGTSIDWLGL